MLTFPPAGGMAEVALPLEDDLAVGFFRDGNPLAWCIAEPRREQNCFYQLSSL